MLSAPAYSHIPTVEDDLASESGSRCAPSISLLVFGRFITRVCIAQVGITGSAHDTHGHGAHQQATGHVSTRGDVVVWFVAHVICCSNRDSLFAALFVILLVVVVAISLFASNSRHSHM